MLAYKITVDHSGQFMLCRNIGEVLNCIRDELDVDDDKGKSQLAEDGYSYHISPVNMPEAEIEEICSREFPGW